MNEIFLKVWEEILGRLIDLSIHSNTVDLTLSVRNNDFIIRIPLRELRVEINCLNKMKGEIITILRTDNRFLIRKNG